MQVYLDESGDMGWKFTAPYRLGGSSRYLCLAFLFLPRPLRKKPKRIISGLYQKYGWTEEKKCSSATEALKLEFSDSVGELIRQFPSIKIECIVAKKENVQPHIRRDANKLYNYMSGLVIVDQVIHGPDFEFIPDKRSIKVESGNSLADYLQTVIWFEKNSQVTLKNNPSESHKNYNLQFVDWIAHCVWSHFEDEETTIFKRLATSIRVRRLYFTP